MLDRDHEEVWKSGARGYLGNVMVAEDWGRAAYNVLFPVPHQSRVPGGTKISAQLTKQVRCFLQSHYSCSAYLPLVVRGGLILRIFREKFLRTLCALRFVITQLPASRCHQIQITHHECTTNVEMNGQPKGDFLLA